MKLKEMSRESFKENLEEKSAFGDKIPQAIKNIDVEDIVKQKDEQIKTLRGIIDESIKKYNSR